MQQLFVDKDFRQSSMDIIDQANEILEDYAAQGHTLTLRQLYYQFVAKALIPNTEKSYKRIGSIISDARLAGLIDWSYMVDRTRNVHEETVWSGVGSALSTMASWYAIDKWSEQDVRPEVWVEKDALIGIVQKACEPFQVNYFSCRGYASQSSQYEAAKRVERNANRNQKTIIIHLGDHDPSGIDMTRDIRDRVNLMSYNMEGFEVRRVALNMKQIEELNPPPNPTKLTDSRAKGYVQSFGLESWELDALSPDYMMRLIQSEINKVRDPVIWKRAVKKEERERQVIKDLSYEYDDEDEEDDDE